MAAIALLGAVALLAYLLYEQGSGGGQDDVTDLGGAVDTSANNVTVKIAQAIARAEGFYVAGSRPQRNNNPGDMISDLIGKSTGKDGAFVIFATPDDGWANLYAQVNAWLNGTSRYHSASSTISDLAGLGSETGYTTTQQEIWAANVAGALGVTVDTQLGEIA